jgi:hypothetical protein
VSHITTIQTQFKFAAPLCHVLRDILNATVAVSDDQINGQPARITASGYTFAMNEQTGVYQVRGDSDAIRYMLRRIAQPYAERVLHDHARRQGLRVQRSVRDGVVHLEMVRG